jgi:hypothetical protein
MEDEGVYIIDDGFTLYVYVGRNVSSEVMLELFATTSLRELKSKLEVSAGVGGGSLDCLREGTTLGDKTRAMLYALRRWFHQERPSSTPVVIQTGIEFNSNNSNTLQYLLVDDPFPDEEEKGYVDYLCILHKRIRQQVEKEQSRF